MRLLQGMIQDLALTCLISGRRAGALAGDGRVLLIKTEQVARMYLCFCQCRKKKKKKMHNIG